MLRTFRLAIKFDCQFLATFQTFIFDELAPAPPLNKRFKICFKSFFESILVQDSLRRAKNLVFFLFSLLVGRPIGGLQPPPPRQRNWAIFFRSSPLIPEKITFKYGEDPFYVLAFNTGIPFNDLAWGAYLYSLPTGPKFTSTALVTAVSTLPCPTNSVTSKVESTLPTWTRIFQRRMNLSKKIA